MNKEKYLFTAQSFLSPEVIIKSHLTKEQAESEVDKMNGDYAEFFRVRSHKYWEESGRKIPSITNLEDNGRI